MTKRLKSTEASIRKFSKKNSYDDFGDDEGTIKNGSIVTVYIEYAEGDSEEETFTLVGGPGNYVENKVSINSPIGECVFRKKVGFEGHYKVNENSIKVKVLKVD